MASCTRTWAWFLVTACILAGAAAFSASSLQRCCFCPAAARLEGAAGAAARAGAGAAGRGRMGRGAMSLRPRLGRGMLNGGVSAGKRRGGAVGLRAVMDELDDEEILEEEILEALKSGKVGKMEIESFKLSNGEVFKDLVVVYEVHGTINEAGDNVIVHPTGYGSEHRDVRYRIGRGEKYELDITDDAVVVVNILGNGVSSSPSHAGTLSQWQYPTIQDNAALIKMLVEEELNVKAPIKLMTGYGLGGMICLQYGALYPDRVARIAPICATARTSSYCRVFIKSLWAALKADRAWDASTDTFTEPPVAGLRTFGLIYAGWGTSSEFYRKEVFKKEKNGGFRSLDDYIEDYFETFSDKEPHDLLSQLIAWDTADISDNEVYKKDLSKALSSIEAITHYIPVSTDGYFSPQDVAEELELVQDDCAGNFEVHTINSVWGHRAGDPFRIGQEQDYSSILKLVHTLLSRDKGSEPSGSV